MSTLRDCAVTFFKNQRRLFDEDVVNSVEEAEEFLDECCTQVFRNLKEVRKFMDMEGFDVSNLTDEELEQELEVFKNPSGDYFVVEA